MQKIKQTLCILSKTNYFINDTLSSASYPNSYQNHLDF